MPRPVHEAGFLQACRQVVAGRSRIGLLQLARIYHHQPVLADLRRFVHHFLMRHPQEGFHHRYHQPAREAECPILSLTCLTCPARQRLACRMLRHPRLTIGEARVPDTGVVASCCTRKRRPQGRRFRICCLSEVDLHQTFEKFRGCRVPADLTPSQEHQGIDRNGNELRVCGDSRSAGGRSTAG